MKVIQVINALSAGGAESFAVQLTTALSEFCDIELLTYAGCLDEKGIRLEQQLRSEGIIHNDAGAVTHWQRALVPFWLHDRIRRTTPDIVHVHLPRVEQFIMLSALLGTRTPVHVRTKHDDRAIVRSLHTAAAARFFDMHVACSPAALAPLNAAGLGHKSVLLANGIASRPIHNRVQIGAEQRLKHGIPASACVAICVGRIEQVDGVFLKAQDSIVEALAAADDLTDLHVVFVGGGQAISSLKQLAAASSANKRIHFTGVLPDITPYVAAANFMLMPSPREGLPMTAIECACFELPLLLSDIEAFAPFRHSSTLYCRAGDISDMVLRLREMRACIDTLTTEARRNGDIYRHKFSIRNVAKKHHALYQSLVARQRGEPWRSDVEPEA